MRSERRRQSHSLSRPRPGPYLVWRIVEDPASHDGNERLRPQRGRSGAGLPAAVSPRPGRARSSRPATTYASGDGGLACRDARPRATRFSSARHDHALPCGGLSQTPADADWVIAWGTPIWTACSAHVDAGHRRARERRAVTRRFVVGRVAPIDGATRSACFAANRALPCGRSSGVTGRRSGWWRGCAGPRGAAWGWLTSSERGGVRTSSRRSSTSLGASLSRLGVVADLLVSSRPAAASSSAYAHRGARRPRAPLRGLLLAPAALMLALLACRPLVPASLGLRLVDLLDARRHYALFALGRPRSRAGSRPAEMLGGARRGLSRCCCRRWRRRDSASPAMDRNCSIYSRGPSCSPLWLSSTRQEPAVGGRSCWRPCL